MKRILSFILLLFSTSSLLAQQPVKLTVEKIMSDPKWIGTSPSGLAWSPEGNRLYFSWNPEQAPGDSIYFITASDKQPVKLSASENRLLVTTDNAVYNGDRSAWVYAANGDIFLFELKSRRTRRITRTLENESNPQFSFNDTKVVYTRNQNLYAWDIATGETAQLTNLRAESAPRAKDTTAQERWLMSDQLSFFEILRQRKEKREAAEQYRENTREKQARQVLIEDKRLQGLTISPDGRFIAYRLFKPTTAKNAQVPAYVTESGFTTEINTRPKVGAADGSSEAFIYDTYKDSIIVLKADLLPGVRELPDYLRDYPSQLEERTRKNAVRAVTFFSPVWSPKGRNAVIEARSADNKDRWLMRFDREAGSLQPLDRQRDEAWIQGPGISPRNTGWIDENKFWFQSEASGYSHLYVIDVTTGKKQQLTTGNYEVQDAQLSNDKKYFYITTNEVHPGEKHFYRLEIATGKKERLTMMPGANLVTISPDEQTLAILYSYTNRPPELFLQPNNPGSKPEQVTFKAQSPAFRAYPWRDPEVVTFTARDGATVYARLYKPAAADPNKPAVLFVHGAGYLQNAHKWWSTYFREYMFNNLLADEGYYVLDIDYRGSAGYGRDWRTGIYRHMGGKDLTDQVDGANWLVKNYGVNPANIGIYGGSYGGFITLMAMFTQPDVFAAGAALRSVTDWSNYNHGYTSNILNEPFTDTLAYRRSSPLYFAAGLKGDLLMLHGMMDLNVHFQDIVELSQRLIELGKDNWELAVYPMEDHGFVEPSSWTDEYKRIHKLFERVLRKKTVQ
ncbi:MAG TPA: prolyl oligopeptidase family serine peptidase [Chitinophagaceae bacterium]